MVSVAAVRETECAVGGARALGAAARIVAVEAVIAAMRARLDRPFSLREMARVAHLSPYYFNRVFRRATGLPPGRFHTALRIAAAKRLLLTTERSVTDVCLDVGYQSLGSFTTHFHELVGVAPHALRRLASDRHAVPLGPDVRAGAGGATVAGTISAPDDRRRVIYVGLFDGPSPQGVPAACAVLIGAGRYTMRGVPRGWHHVAAAAVELSDDSRSYLLPDERSALVASVRTPIETRGEPTVVTDLRLRPLGRTDPPILLALPRPALARLDHEPRRAAAR